MVADLHKACPECGRRYPAADLRCPACGVTWRTARVRQQEKQRSEGAIEAATDFAGVGVEREAFRGGVVGGLALLVVASVLGGIWWLLGWGVGGFLVTGACGLAAALYGLATGNIDGSKRRKSR